MVSINKSYSLWEQARSKVSSNERNVKLTNDETQKTIASLGNIFKKFIEAQDFHNKATSRLSVVMCRYDHVKILLTQEDNKGKVDEIQHYLYEARIEVDEAQAEFDKAETKLGECQNHVEKGMKQLEEDFKGSGNAHAQLTRSNFDLQRKWTSFREAQATKAKAEARTESTPVLPQTES